ncbi:TonB-dependent receptor [Sphingosinicellaceae bacterium]|nr:TonB-dependent receptor [Sphingosinicellaceae bacterium]
MRYPIFRHLLLAATAASPVAASAQIIPAGRDLSALPDDLVITATKRAEPVREIAGAITVQTGAELDKLGAQGFSDYLTRTPGVVFNATTPGSGTITIRGVGTTTGQDIGQATTGIFINEVPLTDPSLSIGTPDIDTFDVDNVAILRGPQGTLFGSSSLGGAINYQAAHPDLDDIAARFQGSVRATRHGGTGGAGKVMLNAPIVTGKLGIRGVFVYREDAGYIDNLGTGETDVNRTVTKSGRILATWAPTDTTTFNYFYLEQRQRTDDAGYQQPGLGGALRKSTAEPEFSTFTTLVHQLRLDQETGIGTITATATRHEKKTDGLTDLTGGLSDALFGLAPISSFSPGSSKGNTFEIRIASPAGSKFEYLVGAMYDRTKMRQRQVIYAAGLADFIDAAGPLIGLPADSGQALAPGDLLVDAALPATAKEMALFGELTYNFSDRIKATVGGRLFQQRLVNGSNAFGLYVLLNAGEYEQSISGSRKWSGFSPKASITWKPSEDLMIYTLASKGFRFGGSNLAVLPGIPSSYDSDSLWNYEIGTRADLLDRKLLVDVTGFYIDWSNIQLKRQLSGVNFAQNAGKAEIYGIEASLVLRPAQGLELSSNLTWLHATLSKDFDPDQVDASNPVIPSGTRLPGASMWQFTNSLSYQISWSKASPVIVLSHRYISRAPSDLEATSRQGGYHLFDARIGGKFGPAGLTLFVENIGDRRGVTNSSLLPPLQQYLVRPRTVGATLDVGF